MKYIGPGSIFLLLLVTTCSLVFLLLTESCAHSTPGETGRFVKVKDHPSLRNDLLSNQISQVVRVIFQDSKGVYWFGTQNGAYKLEEQTLVLLDQIVGESGNSVTIKDISEDIDGTIWLGHTDGLSSIKNDTVKNYYESEGLIDNDVWCIEADQNGRIWVGTIGGCCVLQNGKFIHIELPLGKRDTMVGVSSPRMVQDILEDDEGSIWVSTNAGLFKFIDSSFTEYSFQEGLETPFVHTLFQSKDQKLWVASRKGLYQIRRKAVTNITDPHFVTQKGIGSIAEDKEGKIWFVANQHELYTYYNDTLTEINQSEFGKGPVIFKIYKDDTDRLWFVGFGGAYRLEQDSFVHITKDGPW
jgi:ligand-binding sensor domain-containing protein